MVKRKEAHRCSLKQKWSSRDFPLQSLCVEDNLLKQLTRLFVGFVRSKPSLVQSELLHKNLRAAVVHRKMVNLGDQECHDGLEAEESFLKGGVVVHGV